MVAISPGTDLCLLLRQSQLVAESYESFDVHGAEAASTGNVVSEMHRWIWLLALIAACSTAATTTSTTGVEAASTSPAASATTTSTEPSTTSTEAATTTAAGPEDFSAIAGTWSGVGQEGSFQYDIVVNLEDEAEKGSPVGQVEYGLVGAPEPDCGGEWIVMWANPPTYLLTEQIEFGQDDCPGGTVRLDHKPDSDELHYTFTASGGDGAGYGEAVLTRES